MRRRGTASAAGLLVRSWHAGGEGGAALLYDWERGVLECVFEAGTGDDMATRTELDPEDENQRRVGGAVSGPHPGEPLTVRQCCCVMQARQGVRGFHICSLSWTRRMRTSAAWAARCRGRTRASRSRCVGGSAAARCRLGRGYYGLTYVHQPGFDHKTSAVWEARCWGCAPASR